jgi:cytochrome P450
MTQLSAPSVLRPPALKGRPIFGVLRDFQADALTFLENAARRHGDIVNFRLGTQNAYLLNHPDWIKDVLVTHQSNFTKSRAAQRLRALLGEGLLTSEGVFHHRQRRLAQPAFHRDRLMGYAAAMVECAARCRDRWEPGATFDVSKEMMRLTLAVVGRTLFSADVASEADEIGAALTDVVHLFRTMLMPFSEWLEKLPLPHVRRFKRARDRLDQTIYRLIAERRASGRDTGDLLSMLLLAQDEEGEGGMTDQQVRDEALTLMLAGHETTANALTWSWYLLSQNPSAEAAFHAELDRVLNGRLPAFEDLPQLRYTEAVFAEALRLYPPAWAVGRRAKQDYPIGDYLIPARAIVLMSPWAVHRDPRWFPEPEKFDPERWRPEIAERRPKFSYFPFGGGARVCIGERFAWMEGVLVLAAIGQRWCMRLEPGHRVETRAVITLRPKFGMRMTAEVR